MLWQEVLKKSAYFVSAARVVMPISTKQFAHTVFTMLLDVLRVICIFIMMVIPNDRITTIAYFDTSLPPLDRW
jgi:hypothetical protein